MSNLDRTPALTQCGGLATVAAGPVRELFQGRTVQLGESTRVRRLLPNLGRRLVGAWCFVDHYGPDDVSADPGMAVPPHPHMGLQTVSWLLAGSVHHRDSLGSDTLIGPGELGLMTSGAAIAHAEHSPVPHPDLIHGAQLWVALPASARNGAPRWEHHRSLPIVREQSLTATVVVGEFAGAVSPGQVHSALVGVDLDLRADAKLSVPLEPDFEHAVLVMSGHADVDGVALQPGVMLYLGSGRAELAVAAEHPARLMLLGGEPFAEQIVMWWNFVARTNEEIVIARQEWQEGTRFGSVLDAGERLAAPPLPPGRLQPGGSAR